MKNGFDVLHDAEEDGYELMRVEPGDHGYENYIRRLVSGDLVLVTFPEITEELLGKEGFALYLKHKANFDKKKSKKG